MIDGVRCPVCSESVKTVECPASMTVDMKGWMRPVGGRGLVYGPCGHEVKR